jgi:hypothetical protein
MKPLETGDPYRIEPLFAEKISRELEEKCQVWSKENLGRGEVARISNKSLRSARALTAAMLKDGHLHSPPPKGILYARFPLSFLIFILRDPLKM